ncbi:MAG: class I SAM-dependent RNA methyltransferase [Thalassobaculales bacterium]
MTGAMRPTRRSPRPHSPPPPKAPRSAAIEIAIDHIGGRGDGVGRHEGRPVFVPLTAPGDRVTVHLTEETAEGSRGELHEAIALSPHRAEPTCQHFGPCGGCALQHLDDGYYAGWKHAQVVAALARHGLGDTPVEPLLRVPPGSRRRLALEAVVSRGGRVVLGFHERRGHFVVDVRDCPVAEPALVALLPALRVRLAAAPPASRWRILLTRLDSGIDLLVGAAQPPSLADREDWAGFAAAHDLARVAWQAAGKAPEILAERRPAQVDFGGVAAVLPPGGFLQATAAAEAAMRGRVMQALGAVQGPVADLYAGCGTFALPLARRGPVSAGDGSASAIAALAAAARRAGLPVDTHVFDIAADPPGPAALAKFAGLVFDPPRAGARSLCQSLAAAAVPVVVGVSCNPATFARDAEILVGGGYRLESVVPIDQFLWSAHVELVGVFRRG